MLSSLENKKLILSVINNQVSNCTKCRLCKDPGLSVFGEGSPDAKIMFLGEGPGQSESEQGRPFVGKAGKLLDNMISSIGLTREEVYIANVVKHRPPNNRNPREDEIEFCLPYLKMQIETIHPAIIVVLGSVAMNSLLPSGLGITKRCGNWEYLKPSLNYSILVMPVFHPAALLRNPQWKEPAWHAMQKVKKQYNLIIGKNNNEY